MKKILILLLFISNSVFAKDPNFDLSNRIVFFPRVTVDNGAAFVNVELLLSLDNTWSILAADPESTTDNTPENDPDYNSSTGIVIFPKVTVNNSTAYKNVQLLLGTDGIWSILAAEQEELSSSLTGNYAGATTSNVSASFNAPIIGNLTQDGNQVSGDVTLTSMLGSINGNLTGEVDGSDITLVIDFPSLSSQISLNGVISDDNTTLSGSYEWPAFSDNGTWSLTKQ